MSTPCHPRQPLPTCEGCVSYAPGIAHDPEQRRSVCMDAATVAVHGMCWLYQPVKLPDPKAQERTHGPTRQ